jgi:hypothetical protein
MYFDLEAMLQPLDGLEDLVNPFTTEEIDGIIKELKSDKSPGPDGFNIDFMKRCWEVIKSDLYELCTRFFSHDICL